VTSSKRLQQRCHIITAVLSYVGSFLNVMISHTQILAAIGSFTRENDP